MGSGIGSSSLLRSGNLLGASSAAQQYLYPLSCAWQAVAPRAIGALSPLELSLTPLARARELAGAPTVCERESHSVGVFPVHQAPENS